MYCVVGADGFLGTGFISQLLKSTDEKIVAFNHTCAVFPDNPRITNVSFELCDTESIKGAVTHLFPAAEGLRILFLASVHNPDIVMRDPERAQYINTVCYESFLENIKELSPERLIYASSDTVYGESTDGYVFSEKDAPAPINIYGKQKAMAEEITLRHGYTAARYSYMCGPSPIPRKKHFCDTVKTALEKGEQFPLLTDWNRHTLSYRTAAELTYRLFCLDALPRIINVCSDKVYSKYDIGSAIAEHGGFDKNLLLPVTKNELGVFTEKRADTILMDNSLLKDLTGEKSVDFIF